MARCIQTDSRHTTVESWQRRCVSILALPQNTGHHFRRGMRNDAANSVTHPRNRWWWQFWYGFTDDGERYQQTILLRTFSTSVGVFWSVALHFVESY